MTIFLPRRGKASPSSPWVGATQALENQPEWTRLEDRSCHYTQKVKSQNLCNQRVSQRASVTEDSMKKFRVRGRLLHCILRDSYDVKL